MKLRKLQSGVQKVCLHSSSHLLLILMGQIIKYLMRQQSSFFFFFKEICVLRRCLKTCYSLHRGSHLPGTLLQVVVLWKLGLSCWISYKSREEVPSSLKAGIYSCFLFHTHSALQLQCPVVEYGWFPSFHLQVALIKETTIYTSGLILGRKNSIRVFPTLQKRFLIQQVYAI